MRPLLVSDNISGFSKRSDLVTILLLFLLALGLRLIRLFDLDLNFDEVILLFQSEGSFVDTWNTCKLDNNPPLYPWMVKVWTWISSDVNWYRLFGAIIGSLTPPAAFLLGREILNRKLGLFLGVAAAIAVSLIFYSQFVRMFNLQPFVVCISIIFFLRALETNYWRYWFFLSLINIIGFYIYIFMVFFIVAELTVLIIHYRKELRSYLRPFVSHLPFLLAVSFWVLPIINRYEQVQGEFWIAPHSILDYVRLWFDFGSGSDFRDHFAIAGILNIPFVAGLITVWLKLNRSWKLRDGFIILTIVVLIFSMISIFGQSFYHIRYLLFMLPLYLGLSITGFILSENRLWKRAGLIALYLSMTISLVYYYIDYYEAHKYYGFIRSIPEAEIGEGHNLSAATSLVADKIDEGGVIIHYSDPYLRVCSYYASLYYHDRRYREHIYSKLEIAQHNGRQYLKPGDQIRSLNDIQPAPKEIWLITLNDAYYFFNADIPADRGRSGWIFRENLPMELKEANYVLQDTYNFGKVTVIHYVKQDQL